MTRWFPAAVLCLLIVACNGAASTPPTPSSPPESIASSPDTPVPTATVSVPFTVPVQATALPEGLPAQPTPHPGATDWVKARVDAVVALYQPTDDGEALLRSLDLRQMKGEPGFFGSYGFDDWAGVGEAKPIGVIHELGHSYWGGFPVEGRPDLDWKKPPTAGLSSAMESYHRDILTFMSQPPDGFELLRQRLRNLPDVSSKNTEPVFHHLEADLVYTTGGSLDLVPPILRKYWVDFLSPGRWGDWYGAAGWFQSLTQDERSDTGRWLGFEHFDLRLYPSLAPSYPPDGLLPAANRVLETEEKQRLFDLADQFDLLIGDPRNEENFQSWRGYLQDKVRLQRSYPAYLSSLGRPDTGRLASALGFLAAQPVGTVAEQADRLAARLAEEPFLVNFLPAVDNRVLVELFFSGAALPEGRTLQATASFVERLRVFGAKVESVLQAGRDDAGRGAAELERFLTETGFDQKEDVRLFFDLFRDRDPDTADAVTFALADDTVRRLMTLVPFQLRTILSPEDLLTKLGVTLSTDDLADLKAGITLLVEEASGNFRVDEPFLEALFQVAAARAGIAPRETAQLLLDSPVPLEGMLLAQPAAGALILNSDMDTALTLVRDSDPLLSPPWRVMYRLINADPGLAARLLAEFQRRGEGALVAESLAYFAYDKDRLARSSILPISLEEDGRLLSALFRVEGADWLEARLGESVELYRQRVESGEVSPDFLERYRETLEFAAAFLSGGESRTAVTGIIRRAFGLS